MDFNNRVLATFEIFGQEVWITESIRNTWIVMGVLLLIGLIVKLSLENFQTVPKGFQNVIEAIVDILDSFTGSTMGEDKKGFSAFYGSMFFFILLANLTGLIGLRPPTADLATTFALALITFFMVQGYGVKTKGVGYFKGLFEPMPFLFPLNVIGELANPVSLSFRLFGNILGGVIIMGLFYSMPFWPIKFGIPAVFHAYFDVFAGVLQTFIFVMLSMTFVSGAME